MNPHVDNAYFYNGGDTTNTWTVNGAITVGNGVGPDSRLFVGLNLEGTANHGILNLVGANGSNDSLLLDGSHPADPTILGRLGHEVGGSSWRGTLNISGGLAVTWGGRQLRLEGLTVTNVINVIKGSLNYAAPGFAFQDRGGKLLHALSTNGSIIVDASIDSAAGFDQWGVAKGMHAGDILLETEPDFKLVFTQNPPNTTITAVKPIKGTLVRIF